MILLNYLSHLDECFIGSIVNFTGMNHGPIRLFVCMCLSYLMGSVYLFFLKYIPPDGKSTPILRHTLFIFLGCFQLIYIFNFSGLRRIFIYHILFPWAFIYHSKKPYYARCMYFLCFLWGLGDLSFYNWKHLDETESGANISTYIIIAIIKYTSIISDMLDLSSHPLSGTVVHIDIDNADDKKSNDNYQNSGESISPSSSDNDLTSYSCPDTSNDLSTKNLDPKSSSKTSYLTPIVVTSASQPENPRALLRSPTLIEYIGYMLFFPGLLTGPVIPFKEYLDYVTLAKYNQEIFSAGRYAAFKKFLYAIFFLVCWLSLVPSDLRRKVYQLSESPLYMRIIGYYLIALGARCKYYFVWMLADGSLNYIGIGRRYINGKCLWDKYTNVYPCIIESSHTFRSIIKNWNRSTANWMHQDIYMRLPFPSHLKMLKSIFTFIISAIWHGLNPGYYYAFITAGCFSLTEQILWKRMNKYGSRQSHIQGHGDQTPESQMSVYILCFKTGITALLLTYIMTPFILLHQDLVLEFYASFGYAGHLFLCGMLFVVNSSYN